MTDQDYSENANNPSFSPKGIGQPIFVLRFLKTPNTVRKFRQALIKPQIPKPIHKKLHATTNMNVRMFEKSEKDSQPYKFHIPTIREKPLPTIRKVNPTAKFLFSNQYTWYMITINIKTTKNRMPMTNPNISIKFISLPIILFQVVLKL